MSMCFLRSYKAMVKYNKLLFYEDYGESKVVH